MASLPSPMSPAGAPRNYIVCARDPGWEWSSMPSRLNSPERLTGALNAIEGVSVIPRVAAEGRPVRLISATVAGLEAVDALVGASCTISPENLAFVGVERDGV